ncbi:hypothetical protein ACC712_38220, partial [Rhizobium ruizarguesonis]
ECPGAEIASADDAGLVEVDMGFDQAGAGEWRVAEGMPEGADIEALIADQNRVARNFLLSV